MGIDREVLSSEVAGVYAQADVRNDVVYYRCFRATVTIADAPAMARAA